MNRVYKSVPKYKPALFHIAAFKVVNYNTDYVTMTTNSSFNNLAFMSLCNEAATAYYCVSYHVTAMEGPRQWVMNETLQEIGALVSQTCQGRLLWQPLYLS